MKRVSLHPDVEDKVLDHLVVHYGVGRDLAEPLRRLSGENLNVAVAAGGVKGVFKVATQGQSWEAVDFEHRLTASLAEQGGLELPLSVAAVDGSFVTGFRDPQGREWPARLLRRLSGTPWGELDDRPVELHADLGRNLGRLARRLAAFEEGGPALAATANEPWDLTRAHQHRAAVALVPDLDRRLELDQALRIFQAARADLEALPRTLIHGDVNDENVLCRGGRVSGLIDFGDVCRAPQVVELAIACTYALLHEPPERVAHLVAGYHAERPLEQAEMELVVPLVFGRLATSAAMAARRRRDEPEHPTWFASEAAVWRVLSSVLAAGPRALGDVLLGEIVERPASPTAEALMTERRRRIGPSLSVSYDSPLVIERGRGPYLIDRDGRPFLDLVNNVCHVGHCHPRVVAAGQRQMARLNTNSRYLYPGMTAYAERLCETLPERFEICYFVNSGSEANELALRLAHAATGRRGVLVVDGAYHGNTARLVAASPYKFLGPGGSGRPAPWLATAPMPDVYRGPHRDGAAYAETVRAALAAAAEPVGAFLIEPLLGCGGQIVPPEGYLAAAFEHARAAGAVPIADEVQVGFGRVGTHFWAFEAQGAEPDIVVAGKPIGNGHPMSAVVTTRAIAEAFANGMEFFSTFGGNPVSCAIGMAVLDVIEEEGLQQHALEVGARFRSGLEELASRHPAIGDVRGLGLFVGVELVVDRESREPAAALATAVIDRMRRHGVLLSTDGPLHNVLKIKPPMVLDAEDVAAALRALDEALSVATRT